MRAEDKAVDGPDLERQQRLTESELEKEDEEELPEVIADEQRDLVRAERGALIVAIEAILARDHVVVDQLLLPAHELREETKPPTSLGDPADLAAAQPPEPLADESKKKPWWKRPFG